MKTLIALLVFSSLSVFAGETKTTTSTVKNADGSTDTKQTKSTDMSEPAPAGTTTKKTTKKVTQ